MSFVIQLNDVIKEIVDIVARIEMLKLYCMHFDRLGPKHELTTQKYNTIPYLSI